MDLPLPPSSESHRRKVVVYILGWVLAATFAAVLFLLHTPAYAGSPLGSETAIVFAFLGASTAAEAVVLRLNHGRSEEVITLIEAAVALSILLFPAATALAIALAGIGVAHLIHRRHPVKLLFNLAQYAIALIAALVVFHAIRGGGDVLAARALFGLVVGMTIFGFINASAIAGIVALMEGRSFRSVVTDGLHLTALTVFGNTAIGVLGAVVWQARPELTPLIIAPAATLHFAYRGVVRSDTLLEAVGTERDRLLRIVDGTSDGIVLLDALGAVEVWSPSMEALTGIARENAEGRPAQEVMDPRDLSGKKIDPTKPLRSASPDEPRSAVEMQLPREEGEPKIVLARHTALFDQHRRIVGDVILIHDVTRQREVERMKDDFLASVSHELRSPLTPIKGYAQMILHREEAPRPFVEQAMKNVVERVDHMTILIDDLLLVSRIWAGTATLEDQIQWERFNLVTLVDHALEQHRVAAPGREIDFSCPLTSFETVADPTRVEQILTNLVSNACKYSDPDTPVRVELEVRDDRLELAVHDQGPGIESDHLEAVFERFHRLENPMTMRTGGIGLGLYISRAFAAAMGGSLTVESTVGVGSTFTLSLPIVQNGQVPEPSTIAASLAPAND